MNASAGGSATSKTVCGLTPGLSTSCSVSATNTAGEGGTAVSNNVYLPCPGESGIIFLYIAGSGRGSKRDNEWRGERQAVNIMLLMLPSHVFHTAPGLLDLSVCNLLSSRS